MKPNKATIQGQLKLKIERYPSGLQLIYRDDGRGLDLRAIYNKSLEENTLKNKDKEEYEKICQMIFSSEFSTKNEVSQVSGRGVGMDAVKKEIEQAGGLINAELLQSPTGLNLSPCQFRIIIPEKYFHFPKKI